jgi:hypothetical protein
MLITEVPKRLLTMASINKVLVAIIRLLHILDMAHITDILRIKDITMEDRMKWKCIIILKGRIVIEMDTTTITTLDHPLLIIRKLPMHLLSP